MPECLVGHYWPEIRTADPDIDHITDAFAGVAFPLPSAHAVGEIGHFVQDFVNMRNDVFPIDNNGPALGGT